MKSDVKMITLNLEVFWEVSDVPRHQPTEHHLAALGYKVQLADFCCGGNHFLTQLFLRVLFTVKRMA